MKFSRAVLVSGLLLAGVVANVQAEEGASSDLWLLAKYDVNGDQMISSDEVSGRREKMFGHMDADQDGQVTFDEYQTLDVRKRELLLKARFDKLDLDHNGELSGEEYRSYLGSFDRFDSNGDGRITSAEMEGQPAVAAVAKVDDTHCVLWFCVRGSLD